MKTGYFKAPPKNYLECLKRDREGQFSTLFATGYPLKKRSSKGSKCKLYSFWNLFYTSIDKK